MEASKKENTRKLQLALLDILTAIDKICTKHNLRYYLIAGTLLGAVRHKGFIPWDDDADIALPRKDYETLIKHANKWLPAEYELVSGDKTPHYPYQFARIQDKRTTYILRRSFDYVGGVPIDIFPLDGMTSNPIKQHIHYCKYRILEKMMYYNLVDPYKHGKGIRSIYIQLCHKLFSTVWLHKTLDRIQKEYDYEASPLVADHDNNMSRGILTKEVYGTPTQILFEGRSFYGVQQPEAYLTHCYGKYMEIPKQYPPINFRYLDLNTPYEEYIKNR
jgi:lipopolysaccharide cholinephosphotransferase